MPALDHVIAANSWGVRIERTARITVHNGRTQPLDQVLRFQRAVIHLPSVWGIFFLFQDFIFHLFPQQLAGTGVDVDQNAIIVHARAVQSSVRNLHEISVPAFKSFRFTGPVFPVITFSGIIEYDNESLHFFFFRSSSFAYSCRLCLGEPTRPLAASYSFLAEVLPPCKPLSSPLKLIPDNSNHGCEPATGVDPCEVLLAEFVFFFFSYPMCLSIEDASSSSCPTRHLTNQCHLVLSHTCAVSSYTRQAIVSD
jgi:hypothetical protein